MKTMPRLFVILLFMAIIPACLLGWIIVWHGSQITGVAAIDMLHALLATDAFVLSAGLVLLGALAAAFLLSRKVFAPFRPLATTLHYVAVGDLTSARRHLCDGKQAIPANQPSHSADRAADAAPPRKSRYSHPFPAVVSESEGILCRTSYLKSASAPLIGRVPARRASPAAHRFFPSAQVCSSPSA